MSLAVKHKYYLRKKYLTSDSTERQNVVEEAIARHLVKRVSYGLLSTPLVTKPGPSFTYEISSQESDPLQGHDASGLYVALDAEPYSIDIAGEFTAPTATNEKWLTLVLRFKVTEAQPEIEKQSFTTVFFRQEADFEVVVLEGAEAPLGTATKPSLAGEDGLYICDILVEDADADATTTDIEVDTTRLKLDPIKEAADRGLDGVTNKVILSQEEEDLLRFRDIKDSDEDLEDAILAAGSAGADASDRVAILSDVQNITPDEVLIGNSFGTVLHTGATVQRNIPIPADTTRIIIDLMLVDTSAPATDHPSRGLWQILVSGGAPALDMMEGMRGANGGAGSVFDSGTANPNGRTLAQHVGAGVTVSSYVGAGGDLQLEVTTGGPGIGAGLVYKVQSFK